VQNDALATVIEDLEHFRDVWTGTLPDPDIRRGSATLRRLLVEGEYGTAWRALGRSREPTVPAPDLEAMLGSFDRAKVGCALAGGALHGGIVVAGLCVVQGGGLPAPAQDACLFDRPYTLSQYLASACAYVYGTSITRRDLIKYMANVKGGVHLASNSHARKRERELIARVGALEGRVNHHSKDGLYVELLSIGQSLGKSPDCEALIADFRTRAGGAKSDAA
jgi:hypothetical protein